MQMLAGLERTIQVLVETSITICPQITEKGAHFMDDDDKIRRNLVMFSALVLVTTGLGLPVNQVLAKITGADAAAVGSRSIWFVALAVLAYLWLRYRKTPPATSETPQARIPNWGEEVIHVRRAACNSICQLTQNWPSPYFRLGVLSSSPLLNAKKLVPDTTPDSAAGGPQREFIRLVNFGLISYPGEYWEGEARFAAHYRLNRDRGLLTLEEKISALDDTGSAAFNIPYRVPFLHRLWIVPYSYLKATFYSPATAVTGMPYALAFLALLSIAFNIYNPQWTTKLPPEPPSPYKQVILPA